MITCITGVVKFSLYGNRIPKRLTPMSQIVQCSYKADHCMVYLQGSVHVNMHQVFTDDQGDDPLRFKLCLTKSAERHSLPTSSMLWSLCVFPL